MELLLPHLEAFDGYQKPKNIQETVVWCELREKVSSHAIIRHEKQGDDAAIHALLVSTFDRTDEARLVDNLRTQARPFISLAAENEGEIVGHVSFSPVILSGYTGLNMMGLAPLAVAKSYQRQGIGSSLVRVGLAQCEELGCAAVAVLGYPEYYSRFGFVPSSRFAISCEYDVPPEAFMILELKTGYLADKSGMLKYHSAFNEL